MSGNQDSGTENFESDRLLKIIHYTDALGLGTFTKTVGPHLANAYLASAYLASAYLDSVNLDSAILDSALFIETRLSSTQNLKREQLEGQHPPLLCNAALPSDLTLDPNRDWDRLAEVLHDRYSSWFKTLGEATQWVEKRRPH